MVGKTNSSGESVGDHDLLVVMMVTMMMIVVVVM